MNLEMAIELNRRKRREQRVRHFGWIEFHTGKMMKRRFRMILPSMILSFLKVPRVGVTFSYNLMSLRFL
jgi:hypothetical protein